MLITIEDAIIEAIIQIIVVTIFMLTLYVIGIIWMDRHFKKENEKMRRKYQLQILEFDIQFKHDMEKVRDSLPKKFE